MKKIGVKIFLSTTIIYFLAIVQASAYECKKYPQDTPNGLGIIYKTALGEVFHYFCPDKNGDIIFGESIEYLTLNSKIILKDKSISCQKIKDILVCNAGEGRQTLTGSCNGTQYLIDFNRETTPKIIEFGIKNACNQPSKAKQEGNNIVINFHRNAKFIYNLSTKTFTPPKTSSTSYDPIIDEESPIAKFYTNSNDINIKAKLVPPYIKIIN